MPNVSFFLKYLQGLGISIPTEIQALCFNPLYEGKSVFGLAPTGSGKTLSFVLPLLLCIDCENRNTQVLILVPTRELGSQIARVCQQVADIISSLDHKNILIRSAFGGGPISKQIEEISKKPHVLIGTPGRIIDLLQRESLNTKQLKTLILDEADIMVGMGFSEQIQFIYNELPKKLQIALFSATQNEKTSNLEKVLLKNTEHLTYNTKDGSLNKSEEKFHDTQIKHEFIFSSKEEKYIKLIKFLRIMENEKSGKIIIFCHQRETTQQLAEALKEDGFIADALHGELGQIHRNSIMRNFKNGSLKYLVATNIAARGIDIFQLSAVVHFDVPFTQEDYIHRSGRTGRSGYAGGRSVTFCDNKTKGFYLKLIEDLQLTSDELKLPLSKTLSTEQKEENIRNSIVSQKINFIKIHLNKGKQSKIRPGDIVGAFIQELSFDKEDIGSIFIFDNFSHVEINAVKKKLVLNKIFKVKNLSVKAAAAS